MRRVLAVVFALGLAGALAVDRLDPASVPTPAQIRVRALGGTLACPWAYAGSGTGTLSLANLGPGDSAVRVTLVPDRGRPVVVQKSMTPDSVTQVAVHTRVRGPAGAIVEFAGGEVVASHALAFGRDGAAAGPCLPTGAGTVVVAKGSTAVSSTRIALMNPGAGDAVVDVALVSDGRTRRPEKLRGRLVRARRRLVVDAGDFVFDSGAVTAVVRAEAGRVVAEGLRTRRFGSIEAGVLLPAQAPARSAAVVIGEGEEGAIDVTPIGGADSVLDARVVRARGRGVASDLPTDVRYPGPTSAGITGDRPSAYVVEARGGSPVVVAAAWLVRSGSRTDFAGTVAQVPARRWAGVALARRSRSIPRLVIANPGEETARVSVRLFGTGGSRSVSLPVRAGRLARVSLGRAPGTFAFEIVSTAPVVAAVDRQVVASGFSADALVATPLVAPPPIGVALDPRLGAPAPLERGDQR